VRREGVSAKFVCYKVHAEVAPWRSEPYRKIERESELASFENEHDAREYIRECATDYRVPYDPWVTRGAVPDSIDEGEEIILQRNYVIPPGTFSENFVLADYVYLVYRRVESDNDEVLAE
jgi:hypothetical protein